MTACLNVILILRNSIAYLWLNDPFDIIPFAFGFIIKDILIKIAKSLVFNSSRVYCRHAKENGIQLLYQDCNGGNH